MPQENENRQAILDEVDRISREAGHTGRAHQKQARFWAMIHLALGVPGVILAALAGSIIVAEWTTSWLPGVLALVAAALVGVLIALAPARRARQSEDAANDFIALRDSAQRVRRLDLPSWGPIEARQAMEELVARREDLAHRAPLPGHVEDQEAATPVEEQAVGEAPPPSGSRRAA